MGPARQPLPPTSAVELEATIISCMNDDTVTNGCVLALAKAHNNNFQIIHQILQQRSTTPLLYTIDALRISINRLKSSQLASLKKNLHRNGEEVLKLLKEQFKAPTSGVKRKHASSSFRSVLPLIPDCHVCPVLVDELSTSTEKVKNLEKTEKKYNNLKSKRLSLEPKRINQKLGRKNATIKKKCQEIKGLKEELGKLKSEFSNDERKELHESNTLLKLEVKRLKKQKLSLTKYYKTSCRVSSHAQLEKDLKEARSEIAVLENQYDELKEKNELPIGTKEKNTYNSTVRKCIYYALQHQCPVEKASQVVRFVAESFSGHRVESMPSQTSVARMAREMSVLCDIQAGATLTESQNCTLAWDATDLGGSHLNEIHVSTSSVGKKEYVTLGVTELAGGKTADYVTHIAETIDDVATTYSRYTTSDKENVLKKITANISNTMSDRVVVNHCVNKGLEQTFGHKLVEFNCNIHPLDSLDKAAKAVLRESEVKGTLWGKECAAVNLIQGLCKMRYKQGTGDPKAFKAFFKSRDLPLKDIKRYVGNRFHITFHLAGVFLRLKDELVVYLTRYSTVRGGLQTSLLTDLKDVTILQHLQVLSLFGKLVTGPWMAALYNDRDDMTYYDGVDIIKSCTRALERYQEDPECMLSTPMDAFGGDLDETDATLAAARSFSGDREIFKKVTSKVAERFIVVINRQLERFFTGEESEPSQLDVEQVSTLKFSV